VLTQPLLGNGCFSGSPILAVRPHVTIFVYYFQGVSSCSDTAVTFHKVSPSQMHVLEYLVYFLRPYGIWYDHNATPQPDMYTESSPTEGSLNATPSNEEFSHQLKMKIA
jgi:hypothetical protein